MYAVAVRRDFIARHALVGGDWGLENESHVHHYTVEARLYGKDLDGHGYLIDICEIEAPFEKLVGYFRDENLNDLPEFEGLNPSIEHLARIFWRTLSAAIDTQPLSALSIRIWENEAAWAEYRENL